MRSKQDWTALKTEFVVGDYKSLSEFAQSKGISYNTLSHHVKGWLNKRARHRLDIDAAVRESDKEIKVLTAQKQAEVMSAVLSGMLNQWRQLYAVYESTKDSLLEGRILCRVCQGTGKGTYRTAKGEERDRKCKSCRGAGYFELDRQEQARRSMGLMREIEGKLTDIGKFVELVAGRATDRTGEELDAETRDLIKRFDDLKAGTGIADRGRSRRRVTNN